MPPRPGAGGTRRFDLSLQNGKVSSHPSAYARLALAKKKQLREVELLNGQHPAAFGQNHRSFRQIEALADEGCITFDHALREAGHKAMDEASRFSTPLFPVPPQMRLGWLTDLDRIRCIRSDRSAATRRASATGSPPARRSSRRTLSG
ncbi:MAG: hypothetical protein ACRDSJ_05675 [Rubrobacteraceae bacterium]